MTAMQRLFQVRRPGSRPGHADTLHTLEWLGGEAFVATPPFDLDDAAVASMPMRGKQAPCVQAGACGGAAQAPRSSVQEEASPDWHVL